MDTEELLAQMKQDELEDALEGRTKATPINYARARGMRPQKVYAALRAGKLVRDWCDCGHKVIVIDEADALFFPKEASDEEDEADEG